MPPIHVIAAAALVVGSVAVLVWALSGERQLSAAQSNLGRGGARSSREIALSASARDRLLDPFFAALGRRVRGVTSTGMNDRVQRKLDLSGLHEQGWTVERLVVLRAFSFATAVGLAFLLVGNVGGRETLGIAILIAAVGYLAPEAWVSRKADERQGLIEKQLPEVIDQLSVSVEAGLGLDAAMARSAEGRSGPLADELGRVLQDLQVGVSRDDALDRMVARTDVSDLRGFVVAVRQASRHGLPIARILKIQSGELRDKRRARVEEKAAQLPVKIVFPLVLCILPALFVVILGPAGLTVFDNF